MLDEMRMRTACFARAPQRCTIHLSKHFLFTFQEVTPLSKTRNQLFLSERKGPLTDSSVRKMMAQAGERAELGFPVHPHQLRHGCGYKLANDKQDTRAIQLFLGHRNIQHTVQYTELAAERFQDFWRD